MDLDPYKNTKERGEGDGKGDGEGFGLCIYDMWINGGFGYEWDSALHSYEIGDDEAVEEGFAVVGTMESHGDFVGKRKWGILMSKALMCTNAIPILTKIAHDILHRRNLIRHFFLIGPPHVGLEMCV